jgi:hypothetical protein
MSALTELLQAIQQVFVLKDKIERTTSALEGLNDEIRDHDRRITRLEAQWDTAIQFSQKQKKTLT